MALPAYVTVAIDGLPEAMVALSGFSVGIQKVQTRNAISKGAGVLKGGAIRRVQVESGTLKKNLIAKITQKRTNVGARIGARTRVKAAVMDTPSGMKVVSTITRKQDGTLKITGRKRLLKLFARGVRGSIRSPSKYAHLVEKGTRLHTVSVKTKRVLARSGAVFGTSVQIKAKPHPFLEPTARIDGPSAVRQSIEKLKGGIEIERAKAMARSKKPR